MASIHFIFFIAFSVLILHIQNDAAVCFIHILYNTLVAARHIQLIYNNNAAAASKFSLSMPQSESDFLPINTYKVCIRVTCGSSSHTLGMNPNVKLDDTRNRGPVGYSTKCNDAS